MSTAPVASGIRQRRIPCSDSVPTPLHGNRFAVLGQVPEAEVQDRPRRRLVFVSQHRNDRQDLDEWDSDTDTVGGVSDAEVTEVVEPTVEEVPVPMDARVRAPVRAFTSLDAINVTDLFEHRAKLMQQCSHSERNVLSGDSRWRRTVMSGPCLVGNSLFGSDLIMSRKKLEARVRQFQEGEWISLLRESVVCAEAVHSSSVGPSPQFRASFAPGNLATLGMITDPRPPVPEVI